MAWTRHQGLVSYIGFEKVRGDCRLLDQYICIHVHMPTQSEYKQWSSVDSQPFPDIVLYVSSVLQAYFDQNPIPPIPADFKVYLFIAFFVYLFL